VRPDAVLAPVEDGPHRELVALEQAEVALDGRVPDLLEKH
jgi:hypothetical protein